MTTPCQPPTWPTSVDEFRDKLTHANGCMELVTTGVRSCSDAMTRGDKILCIAPHSDAWHGAHNKHLHDAFEWVLQGCGESLWTFREKTILVKAGEMLLIPRGVSHRETLPRDSKSNGNVNITVRDNGIGVHLNYYPRPRGSGLLVLPWRSAIPVEDPPLLNRLVSEAVAFTQAGPQTDPYVHGLVTAVLGAMRHGLQDERAATGSYSTIVAHCRERILHHLSKPELSVAALAREIGCNADYLSHQYHMETGERLMRVIARERMRLARRLLAVPEMSIADVSRASGYADPNYFARVFGREFGTSPRNWRRSAPAPVESAGDMGTGESRLVHRPSI